jgi:DNA-binding GntR family transcriptional regulator
LTTRFSLAELSEMFHVPVDIVRRAVDELSQQDLLTAESFVFGERNWRVAPSDTKRIQQWIVDKQAQNPELFASSERRRVKRKVIEQPAKDLGEHRSDAPGQNADR